MPGADEPPRAIASLSEVAAGFDAIVLDQWGVLHDGTRAAPGAIEAVRALGAGGARLAVLSNSGKRAALNARRIEAMGFRPDLFACVMTSGEALWLDLARGAWPGVRRFLAVTGAPGDAEAWLDGLPGASLAASWEAADAILVMGLPEDADLAREGARLAPALAAGRPMLCSNPDRASPRAGGRLVPSPGALAAAYEGGGGRVAWYGKPHRAVFEATARALGLASGPGLLMVGDSLAHDVAGAAAAGWRTALVRGGLHAGALGEGDPAAAVRRLAGEAGAPVPDLTLGALA